MNFNLVERILYIVCCHIVLRITCLDQMICLTNSVCFTGLMLAAYAGNADIVDLLLKRGANAHLEDHRGREYF